MKNPVDSYLLTRVSILGSQLLKLDEWQSLVDASLETLQKRFNCFSDNKDINIVEKKLINNALTDYYLLFRPFSGVKRDMLNYAVHWYELANLKTLIRGKFSGASEASIQKELVDLGHFGVLPLETLLQADDPNEMLRLIENTPYHSIVRQARSIYHEQGQNLFSLDAAIDRQFFTGLMQRIRFLHEDDRFELMKVYGALMDRFNLLWLIRYRFSYQLSPAKSYYLLATTGNKLFSTKLMQLAKLGSIQEVIEQLPEPLDHLLKQAENLTEIENIMEYYMMNAALKGMKQSPSVITRIFSYVLLRESEIHLIQAVMKGKLLDFRKELIHKAVGGTR